MKYALVFLIHSTIYTFLQQRRDRDILYKTNVDWIKCPFERGSIVHWREMRGIWGHVFSDDLRVCAEEHPVLVTESPLSRSAMVTDERERMVKILFEEFGVPAVCVMVDAVLAIYASGRTTGLVLDCGDTLTSTVPVYEGHTMCEGIHNMFLGGKDLTDYLVSPLSPPSADTSGGFTRRWTKYEQMRNTKRARYVKESFCYVATDYEAEMKKFKTNPKIAEKTYELPNGDTVKLGCEAFRCPEILFQPSLVGKDYDSVHKSIHYSITECDPDLRRHLYDNIFLSGGSTLFPGIQGRLSKEMVALAPSMMDVKVVAIPERKNAAWIGGSIVSSLASFQSLWITNAEFEEFGAIVVHRKCF